MLPEGEASITNNVEASEEAKPETLAAIQKQQDWQRRRRASFHSRQGQFTGARYYLSNIIEGYKAFFELDAEQTVRGLCLNKENQDNRTISSFEMIKILSWIKHCPTSNFPMLEAKGEVNIPFGSVCEQDEASEFVYNKLSRVYGAQEIHLEPPGISTTFTTVEFSLKTKLKPSSVEPIIKMLLDGCDVVVNVNRIDSPHFSVPPRPDQGSVS
jgi:hypothetical protein